MCYVTRGSHTLRCAALGCTAQGCAPGCPCWHQHATKVVAGLLGKTAPSIAAELVLHPPTPPPLPHITCTLPTRPHIALQEVGFFDTVKTGDITSRLAADTTTVSDQISLNLNVMLRSLTQAAMVGGGHFLVMFFFQQQAGLVAGLPPQLLHVQAVASAAAGHGLWASMCMTFATAEAWLSPGFALCGLLFEAHDVCLCRCRSHCSLPPPIPTPTHPPPPHKTAPGACLHVHCLLAPHRGHLHHGPPGAGHLQGEVGCVCVWVGVCGWGWDR